MSKLRTLILGHKNPDTDSICAAISYADLKSKTEEGEFSPRRAGEINEETKFVLNYFKVKPPKLTESVKTQIKDIDIKHTKGVDKNISFKKAWSLMQELDVVTLPAVNEDGDLEGIISVSDIANSYMNIYDSRILAKANTRYSSIIETLDGTLVVGDKEAYFNEGKVVVAAANPDMLEPYIEKDDLVILGNRYEMQLCAIEMGAACIIVCEGAGASKTIQKIAKDHGTTVITTAYDSFTVARLINQSMPINYFMKTENLITFENEDYLDDVRDVMANVRHRDFPVLDKHGKYLGMSSRRNLLGAKGKRVIMVDHNERSQAVDGIEHANVLEIIDHHRLGTIETIGPVYFRNQPLGCTSTIIYQMYQEKGVEIPPNIAGLMCSAIISDTLLFRSPTCTAVDKAAGLALAKIAGIDIEKYANQMFASASNLKGKTDEQIFHQDYKTFALGKSTIGIGQISSLNEEELSEIESRLMPFLIKLHENSEEDMMFFMLTNILEQSTRLICVGQGAMSLVMKAFRLEGGSYDVSDAGVIELTSVVSRKKQLVPSLVVGIQM